MVTTHYKAEGLANSCSIYSWSYMVLKNMGKVSHQSAKNYVFNLTEIISQNCVHILWDILHEYMGYSMKIPLRCV